MKPCKVGQLPAKADASAQEAFKTGHLAPRLAAAQSGQRRVCFMAAAHFVCAPFLGLLWCLERLFVKAPRGWQRLNVLAALHATPRHLCTVKQLTSITSETVCALLRRLAGAHPGGLITVVLDQARYQRCALGQRLAQRLGIEWLFLPASSPNLHLMERCWKFVQKQGLSSKDYADHHGFPPAIIACIAQAPTKHKEEWDSLLSVRFQSCKAVRVIGEGSNVSVFPVARQTQRKVSSQAA